jgi:type III secretion protein U
VIPVFVLCMVVSAVPALLLSKFSLATEALKIDFAKLNPVEGVKKLFSLRTVKDLVKALLYLLMFAVAFWVLWANNKTIIFAQLHGQVTSLASVMASLFMSFMAISMLCCLPVFVLDSLAEFYLHIKNLKMDKHEVKREYKEQEGNPEFKQHRREVHMELLSEQVKSDVKQSNFILANPTHIALGVYFRPELCPAPMISLIETDARARAVIAYAEKCGVPVVRDIPLARSLYKAVSRYSLVPFEYFHGILSILEWLHNVETFAHLEETTPDSSETETPQP